MASDEPPPPELVSIPVAGPFEITDHLVSSNVQWSIFRQTYTALFKQAEGLTDELKTVQELHGQLTAALEENGLAEAGAAIARAAVGTATAQTAGRTAGEFVSPTQASTTLISSTYVWLLAAAGPGTLLRSKVGFQPTQGGGSATGSASSRDHAGAAIAAFSQSSASGGGSNA
jgi:hypothetical protein